MSKRPSRDDKHIRNARPLTFTGGTYGVTRSGKVVRLLPGRGTAPGRVLRPFKDRYGEFRVRLCFALKTARKKTTKKARSKTPRTQTDKRVSYLVLLAWGKRPKRRFVTIRHLDGNRQNNDLDNLEVVYAKGDRTASSTELVPLVRKAARLMYRRRWTPEDIVRVLPVSAEQLAEWITTWRKQDG